MLSFVTFTLILFTLTIYDKNRFESGSIKQYNNIFGKAARLLMPLSRLWRLLLFLRCWCVKLDEEAILHFDF